MSEPQVEYTCNVCSCEFNIDTEGGRLGDIGILPVAFCPTCLAGLYDMVEQFPTEEIEEPGETLMAEIKGYRELSDAEIEAINNVKELGPYLENIVHRLQQTYDGDDESQRWIAVGKTHLQQGLMALTRAIAKPEGF
jgi:hypothetical protein